VAQQPKTGDRVRVTTRNFEPDYQRGDKGTVMSGPHQTPSGGFFYVVQMDKDGPAAAGIIVHEEELEDEDSESVSG
jgi:hypothetical protein